MERVKVFCVGLSKTGTTSFGECMKLLGYHHLCGFDQRAADYYLGRDIAALDELVAQHDSFDDWPWPSLFKRYAHRYPNSKFVLTTRKSSLTWLESYKVHCETLLFQWSPFEHYNRGFFGTVCPHGQEEAHIRVYENHSRIVQQYFCEQPQRLLQLCFDTDPVWDKLCAFLSCEPSTMPVPHVNKRVNGIPWRRIAKRMWLHGYGRYEKAIGNRCAIGYL